MEDSPLGASYTGNGCRSCASVAFEVHQISLRALQEQLWTRPSGDSHPVCHLRIVRSHLSLTFHLSQAVTAAEIHAAATRCNCHSAADVSTALVVTNMGHVQRREQRRGPPNCMANSTSCLFQSFTALCNDGRADLLMPLHSQCLESSG